MSSVSIFGDEGYVTMWTKSPDADGEARKSPTKRAKVSE
jgi:hypothetical protein